MDHKERNKKLRRLIRTVNIKQKEQALKIDILCNDFIAAQRDFIKNLNTISFTAGFYESIIGTTDLNSLLYTVDKLIKDEIDDGSVAFFLRHGDNFELHMLESHQPIGIDQRRLESCFTPEIMKSVCKSNKLCSLDDLFAMGLQANPAMLKEVSAVTIPLGQYGPSLGFILIYVCSQDGLTQDQINNINAVTCGLSRAIHSCQAFIKSPD